MSAAANATSPPGTPDNDYLPTNPAPSTCETIDALPHGITICAPGSPRRSARHPPQAANLTELSRRKSDSLQVGVTSPVTTLNDQEAFGKRDGSHSMSVSSNKRASSFAAFSKHDLVKMKNEASEMIRLDREQQMLDELRKEHSDDYNEIYGEDESKTALNYRALWLFRDHHPARVMVYKFTRHGLFEGTILLLIFFNCTTLVFDDPEKEPSEFQFISEVICNIFFSIEMVLKIFSDGFLLHPHSYLRSTWNQLDFFIVIFAWVAFIPSVGNYTGIRIIRVMRALRSINGIQGLKNIVNALLLSVRGLLHVLFLVVFFFTIFGILGVQLFKGTYKKRCLRYEGDKPPGFPQEEGQFCASDPGNVFFGRECDSGTYCLDFENPERGFGSFDHIGWAALIIFRCITLEGWVVELYRVLDLHGFIALAYFLPIVVLGSFFILNLALAVISERFRWTNEVEATRQVKDAIVKMIEEDQRKEAEKNDMEPGAENLQIVLTDRQMQFIRLRVAGKRVINSKAFEWGIIAFIFINTAFLAVEHDGQPEGLSFFLNYANMVLTGIFTGEMAVKVLILGPRQYVSDPFNVLDGGIVLISVVDVFIESSSGVTVFRALRLLRVLKLIKNFHSLRQLVSVLLHAVADTGFLNVLIFLYLYIAALVGTQLYSGQFRKDNLGKEPVSTFDNFWWSSLTVFQILTRDNWTLPMWDAMTVRTPASCLFFVLLVLVGDFIILNLFLAILINSFESNMNRNCDDNDDGSMFNDADNLLLRLREVLDETTEQQQQSGAQQRVTKSSIFVHSRIMSIGETKPLDGSQLQNNPVSSTTTAPPLFSLHTHTASGIVLGGALNSYAQKTIQHQHQWPSTNGGNALYVFGPSNTVRIFATYLVNHPMFERIILLSIATSSILLIVEDPRVDMKAGDPLNIANMFFTALFCVEMLCKLVAFGLVRGEGAYLKDGWNVLDAIVVMISLFALVFAQFQFVKVFRIMRTLRPLRVVNRNLGLKIVVRSLLRSLPQVANVGVVVSLIFFVFAILGVQLFGGKLNYCTDEAITEQARCDGFLEDAYEPNNSLTLIPREWRRRDQHFDDIRFALLTLFEVSTLELWSKIMYNTIDSHAKGMGPIRHATPQAGLYFITFIIFGSFFVLNMFVGVVIYNYNVEKKMMEGKGLLSAEQERWIEMQRLMLTFRPVVKMPYLTKGPRRFSSTIASSPAFEYAIYTVIMLNVAVMGMEHEGQSMYFEKLLGSVNNACSGFFLVEMCVKLHAWRWTYFRNGWNRYDCLLVLVSVSSLPYELLVSSDSAYATPIKLFRILRVLRLLKSSRGMRLLLETLWYSLPYLSNIFLFLGLVFFVYGALGVSLFHDVKRGEYLTYHANFDNFPVTILVLFRASTGEDWNGIMHDLMTKDCGKHYIEAEDRYLDKCGPGMWIAPLYFMSFLCIAAEVMLNLFIAVILDNFSTTVHIEKSKVGTSELNRFVSIWSDFDPDADLLVPTSRFPQLLARLGPPLGVNDEFSRIDLMRQCERFQIPEHGGMIHFVEVLIPLARLGMGVELSDNEMRQQENGWREDFPDILKLPTLRYRQRRVTVNHFFAATYIAAAFRRSVVMKVYLPRRNTQRLNIANYWKSLRTRDASTQTEDPYARLKLERNTKRAEQIEIDERLEREADEARDHNQSEGDFPHPGLFTKHTGVSCASGGAVSGVSTIPLTVQVAQPRDQAIRRVDL